MSGRKEITYTIDPVSECWNCNSHAPDSHGYPRTSFGGKNVKIFRHYYTLFKGPIPPGLLIRHSCDNRRCINPDHLQAGTHMDNMMDAIERGRLNNRANKLTAEKVLEIRGSTLGERKLSKIYGVCAKMIWCIKNRTKWKNI